MAKSKSRQPGREANLIAWRRSPEFRAIANRTLAEFNANQKYLPRCGAKRKSDGEPCRGFALKNGRCRFHGGLTPRGDNWHKPRLPKRGEARGVERLDRKLVQQEKLLRARRARLAAMSPEQREKHLAWHATHRPKTERQREQTRQDRAAKKWLSDVMKPVPATSDKPTTQPKRHSNKTSMHEGIFR